MATGTVADIFVDLPAFHRGVFEGASVNLNIFNGLSNGAILLEHSALAGNYSADVMFKSMMDAMTRRDNTSTSAVASGDVKKISEITQLGVKRNTKTVVENTIDFFRKSIQTQFQGDPAQWSQKMGEIFAEAKAYYQMNDALAAGVAALRGQSTNLYTVPTNGTLQKESINAGRAKLGDQAGNIKVCVMHSKPYFDLIDDQVADNILQVSGAVLYGGTPATYGIPTLVTDSPSLVINSGTVTTPVYDYYSLLLTDAAVVVTDSEDDTMMGLPTSAENILYRLHAEGAHNVAVKGFAWDSANGGANPSDAAFKTTTNWDVVATSTKTLAGAVIKSR